MKVYVIVILTLVKLGASQVDEELDEKFKTLPRSDFVAYFNKQNYTWKIKQYSDLAINLEKTDSHDVNERFFDQLPVRPRYPPDVVQQLPPHFDSREKWHNCRTIGEIYNQELCGACWAFSVANVASDRTCIHTNKDVELSVQDFECANGFNICHGGNTPNGLLFWKEAGLVTRQCKKYNPYDKNRLCVRSCDSDSIYQNYEHDRYYAREIYAIPNDDDQIRAEIYFNGPITATFQIYEDFQNPQDNSGYHSGIYVYKYGAPGVKHAVRVIGYGEENGEKYWLVANSWSKNWGENGYFRIRRFQNGVNFEQLMFAGMPAYRQ